MGHQYNRKNLYAMCVSLWAQKEEMKTLQCAGERGHSGLKFISGEDGDRGLLLVCYALRRGDF